MPPRSKGPTIERLSPSRRQRARVRLAGAAIVVGLLLAGGAIAFLRHDRSSPTAFGSVTPRPSSSADPDGAGTSPVVVSAGELTRPTALHVPALDVDAPVERVVTIDGVLGVPDDIGHVGWWAGSALPGAPAGTTVIDGHVDSAADGEGALFRVDHLRAGQQITLMTHNGRAVGYRVYARRVYSKAHALPATLFDPAGAPRLVLITCGGPFDSAAHSYRDNIAVFARPIT